MKYRWELDNYLEGFDLVKSDEIDYKVVTLFV